MMKIIQKIVVALILGGFCFGSAPLAEAVPPEIVETQGEAAYNETFTFQIVAKDLDKDISSAYVEYAWLSDDVKVRKPIRFDKGQGQIEEKVKVPATKDWRPPGSKLVYQWFVRDAAGNLTTGPLREIIYQDNRYQWKKIESKHFVTYHYASPAEAKLISQIAEDNWQRITTDIGYQLPEKTRIYVYADHADYMEVGDDSLRDWAGGSAYTADNLFILPASNEKTWLLQLVPHEFTHIVLDGKLGEYQAYAPLWLSEGMSMFEEDSPEAVAEYMNQVAKAMADGDIVPLGEMINFDFRDDAEVSLMYAQCFTIVKFLYDTYGREKLNLYIDALSKGKTDQDALQQVYNLDTKSLEKGWLAFIAQQPAPKIGEVLMRGDILIFSSVVLLFVVIGFYRYRRENKRRRAMMLAEEADDDIPEEMWNIQPRQEDIIEEDKKE